MIAALYARVQPLLPALFWLALVFAFVMALLPKPPQVLDGVGDKWQHMAAFATLSLLGGLAWPRLSLLRLGIALAVFGAVIEILQLTPGLNRTGDLRDWIADVVAIVVTLAFVALLRRHLLAESA